MKLKKQDSKVLKLALDSMPKPSHPKKKHPFQSPTKSALSPESGTHGLESILAQRLASNEPLLRNKTMRKVRKWIRQRSEAKDNSEAFTEVEMMRLWKGLFYCYWMSDKPLVQEELAESIGKLIESFGSNTSSALLFVASFMSTIGREWVGIDRWRMDKFMMLVRRFLRQCFLLLERNNWDTDLVAKWNEIVTSRTISANSLLARPLKKKKHKMMANGQANCENVEKPKVFHKVALGYQLHFTDVFLEELAKIGAENLQSATIQALMKPFIMELTIGSNDLLCKHIEQRVFQHLMRQSDSGIAFEDALNGDVDDEDDHEDNDSKLNGDETNDSDLELDMSEDEDLNEKDPRAGGVSVVLPQIQPDFAQLANDLFEAGSGKDVQIQRRARLYRLSKQFKDLSSGTYPLAAGFEKDPSSVPKIKAKKAALRTLKNEAKRIEKSREERKQYKLAMKKKASKGSIHSDQNDDEKLENTKKPTVDSDQVITKEKKNGKKAEKSLERNVELDQVSINGQKLEKEGLELEQDGLEDNHVSETSEDLLVLNTSTTKKIKKRRKKDQDEEKVVVIKKKKKMQSNVECVTPDSRPPKNDFITRSLPASKKSSANKRINFSLKENKCSSLQDIDKSISESPQIPFDASKMPKQGVLKKTASVTSSPSSPQVASGRQAVAYNTMLNRKSKFANRFMSPQFIFR